MIPKKLISCWFGRGRKNDLFLRCRAAKERHFLRGEWEWIDVDEDSCDLMDTPYMRAVVARGEFVKCTELARLWALATHGGVYLDEDVEPIRSFDPLLAHEHSDGLPLRFFAAREGARPGEREWINGAVLGAMPIGRAISRLLERFPHQSEGVGSPHDFGPGYLTREVEAMIAEPEGRYGGALLRRETFYPTNWWEELSPDEALARATPDTFAVHHWAKSWIKRRA